MAIYLNIPDHCIHGVHKNCQDPCRLCRLDFTRARESDTMHFMNKPLTTRQIIIGLVLIFTLAFAMVAAVTTDTSKLPAHCPIPFCIDKLQ